MAIDDNKVYGLSGAQLKELPGKIEAVKGLAKVLTADDYNYPENDPTMINTDTLPAGVYLTQESIRYGNQYSSSSWDANSIVVFQSRTNFIEMKYNGNTLRGVSYGSKLLISSSNIVDNLTSTLTTSPLSANQGKVLKDMIDALPTGGITELTSADYNYPTDNPDGINPLALGTGIYKITKGTYAYVGVNGINPVRSRVDGDMYFIVDNDPQTSSKATIIYPVGVTLTDTEGVKWIWGLVGSNNGAMIVGQSNVLTSQKVRDNLTSTDTLYPLSANQGKVLNDKITPTSGTGAPTTATVGELGKIYIDTDTDTAYMCVKADTTTPEYTWKQITA